MKVRLQGEWKSGRVYLQGVELQPMLMPGIVHRRAARFSWGTYGAGAGELAMAILTQFVSPQKARALCEAFRCDVISQLPQTDFTCDVDVRRWIAKELTARKGGRESYVQCRP